MNLLAIRVSVNSQPAKADSRWATLNNAGPRFHCRRKGMWVHNGKQPLSGMLLARGLFYVRSDSKDLPKDFCSDLEDTGIAAKRIRGIVEQRIADRNIGLNVAEEVIYGVCVVD